MHSVIVRVRRRYNPAPLQAALQTLRQTEGLTQQTLAQERGISHVHMNRILRGKAPTEAHINWLCRRLGVAETSVWLDPPVEKKRQEPLTD